MSSSLLGGDFLAELRFTGRSEDDFPAELRPRDLASGYAIPTEPMAQKKITD